MKIKELKELPRIELEKKREELTMELMKDYAHIAAGSAPKNPGKIRVVRKTIARINTFLHQQEKKEVV